MRVGKEIRGDEGLRLPQRCGRGWPEEKRESASRLENGLSFINPVGRVHPRDRSTPLIHH